MPWPDALKALAALAILLHHALLYGPLATALAAAWPAPAQWLQQYGRYAVQIFLVLGGYLAAAAWSRAGRQPLAEQLLRRHWRLALPFMAAVGLTLAAHALTAPWLPELLPQQLDLGQLLAHALLLQGVLEQEALTVGAWYVAIDFQLYLLLGLLLRGRHASLAIAALCLASAFVFNRFSAWDNWAPYFFAAYGLGALVQRLQAQPGRGVWLALLSLALLAALAIEPRGRLALALGCALLLAAAQWQAWRAPAGLGRWAERAGRHAYALFLLHFPVLLLANALWVALALEHAFAALTLLLLACWAAYQVAEAFHRRIELPCARIDPLALLRKARWALPLLGLLAGLETALQRL